MSAKTNAIREDFDRMRRLKARIEKLERALQKIQRWTSKDAEFLSMDDFDAFRNICREALEEK